MLIANVILLSNELKFNLFIKGENNMKKVLSNSMETMGLIFIIFIILSLLFPNLFTLTVANKIYLLVFFVAVLIGNTVRAFRNH